MKSNRENFLELRAEEVATMYDSTFTKKEATKTGQELVTKAIEEGNVNKKELLANISRLKWVIESADTELRKNIEIYEKETVLGLEFNYLSGGNTINYAEDEIYATIKKELDARTEQLKLAQKQDVFDAYGNQVPKVSTSPRKSSITIK